MVSLTHGLALTFCAALFGGISGGHVNPAVSLAFLLKRKINAIEFIVYTIAQVVGGFLAAMGVYFLYFDWLNRNNCAVDFANNTCVGVFTTSGAGGSTNLASAFFVEAFGTFVLICAVLATADKRNTGVKY